MLVNLLVIINDPSPMTKNKSYNICGRKTKIYMIQKLNKI